MVEHNTESSGEWKELSGSADSAAFVAHSYVFGAEDSLGQRYRSGEDVGHEEECEDEGDIEKMHGRGVLLQEEEEEEEGVEKMLSLSSRVDVGGGEFRVLMKGKREGSSWRSELAEVARELPQPNIRFRPSGQTAAQAVDRS